MQEEQVYAERGQDQRTSIHQTYFVFDPLIGVRAFFCQGGGERGKPFAQKIFASCPNLYKTVEQKRGPMQQHRLHWHMKMAH